jgi:hypothetical protein
MLDLVNSTITKQHNLPYTFKHQSSYHGVKAVPTTIIDGKIKVVGVSDFPWICGEYLYNKLRYLKPIIM